MSGFIYSLDWTVSTENLELELGSGTRILAFSDPFFNGQQASLSAPSGQWAYNKAQETKPRCMK